MFDKFKLKYGIKSNSQLVIIFIVFGITGSTAAYISDPLMELINIKKSDLNIFVY